MYALSAFQIILLLLVVTLEGLFFMRADDGFFGGG